MNKETRLDLFQNNEFKPGSVLKRTLWYLISLMTFQTKIPYPSVLKRVILRLFGAKIGKGVVIKPDVQIKYPWNLIVGDWSWIGEKVWIDNLGLVTIGSHCCLSQGSMLLCGNHNYKSESFDLIVQPIHLENGVWIGAKALVNPGVICRSHSVAGSGSVISVEMEAYQVYSGNPARIVRQRRLNS